MEYLLFTTAILFIALAFILTENNAKYLLAGYNTLSADERKKVNIKELITYFKSFFIFLGISLLPIGLFANHYLTENLAGLIISVYITLACIYLVISSRKFYKKD
jgi:small neutral amino acid transporter SnatA (MarC family)